MSAKQAQEPRLRGRFSAEHRAGLSAGQRAFVASDPRWAAHRQKLIDAQIARRMSLFPSEVEAVVVMRGKGRTFSYIAEEIGICHDVIRRDLRARGISTARVKAERRACRGRGFWRSFDEP